jgi:hypothetical protein
MNSIDNIETWYGELRTHKGNTVIIRDNLLPVSARAGRVYLYNTDRNAIIEYDETIVKPKLFPLEKEAQKKAEKTYGRAWLVARQLFLQAHGKDTPVPPPPELKLGNINIDDDPILDPDIDDDD